MKILKKFLRILAILLPCLCFGMLYSQNTSALKYDVKSIPLYDTYYYINSDYTDSGLSYLHPYGYFLGSNFLYGGIGFSLSSTWRSEYAIYNYKDSIPQPSLYSSDLNSDNDCYYRSARRRGTYSVSNNGQFVNLSMSAVSTLRKGILFDASDTSVLSIGDFADFYYCDNVGTSFGNAPLKDYDFNSLPVISELGDSLIWEWELQPRKIYPYSYAYDAVYLSSSDVVDGVVKNYNLSSEDLFGENSELLVSGMDSLYINFGVPNSSAITLDYGRKIELSGSLIFQGIDMDNFSGILNSYVDTFEMVIAGYENIATNGGILLDNIYDISSCSVTSTALDSGSDSGATGTLNFSCSYQVAKDFYGQYFTIALYIDSSDSTQAIFNYNSFEFMNFAIVTDDNYTDSGEDYDAGVTGGYTAGAPGSPESSSSGGSSDWTASLKDLFNFSFVNPFASLFNLFVSDESCASIPTLASMLHSSETTVCHWFNSETRAITTPILGISSMMLIFGFVVRWLGASSGNLFEDSQKEELKSINGSGFKRMRK